MRTPGILQEVQEEQRTTPPSFLTAGGQVEQTPESDSGGQNSGETSHILGGSGGAQSESDENTGGSSAGQDSSLPGGSSSAGNQTPLNNPRPGGGGGATQLYNPSANLNTISTTFPGEGPKVATNAVTVNVMYGANSHFVAWSLSKESFEQDDWLPWFRSSRGMDGNLQSRTFENLPAGWWRFQLTDPQAEARSQNDDPSIRWMSIMAPRGENPWARNKELSLPIYNVYFRINDVGIVSEVNGDAGFA